MPYDTLFSQVLELFQLHLPLGSRLVLGAGHPQIIDVSGGIKSLGFYSRLCLIRCVYLASNATKCSVPQKP